jgi:hypothetical protein
LVSLGSMNWGTPNKRLCWTVLVIRLTVSTCPIIKLMLCCISQAFEHITFVLVHGGVV